MTDNGRDTKLTDEMKRYKWEFTMDDTPRHLTASLAYGLLRHKKWLEENLERKI